MRNIGAEEGIFVLGILDCCREKLPQPTKAGYGEVEDSEPQLYSNCVISFGCRPSSTVNAESKIAVEYFAKLRQFANNEDGSILVPGEKFYRWKPNDQGETLAMADDDLILYHSDWNPQPSTAVEEDEKKVDEDQEEEEESKVGFAVTKVTAQPQAAKVKPTAAA